MWKQHKRFTLIFLLIMILNLMVQFGFLKDYNLFVKPLITISLALYMYSKCKMQSGFNRLIFAGLLFSLFGDCFLIFATADVFFFLYGLVAFLLAHILYSTAFFRDFKNSPQASKRYGHLMLFLMGVFSMSYYTWIRDYLNNFRIPVLVYIFVISTMAILAAYRYKRVNLISFRLIYWGALFFVISDSILAYNKFVEPFNLAGALIMFTYMIAQYLITMGAINRKVEVQSVV